MTADPPQDPARSPYAGLPDRQFWRREPGIADPDLFDPVSRVPFRIGPGDGVVTAGSCFAEHLGRRLASAGYRHLIVEKTSPMIAPKLARRFGYGVFAARYGNVYTARQLLQLLRRAYGEFEPVALAWQGRAGGVVDPFRPQIQPGGFVSERELRRDREVHFAAVREAVERLDVLVFTLGLTEAWEDRADGAVVPLAPGVAGGVWDPGRWAFRNFGLEETAADLMAALAFVRARNPGCRIVLTVSPVPLNATYEDRHVWVSTTLSKAVLRLAAERAQQELAGCAYFPSYEIVTAPHVQGRYFAEDRREVTPEGVDHVMRLFLKHFGGGSAAAAPGLDAAAAVGQRMEAVARQLDVFCDERSITNR